MRKYHFSILIIFILFNINVFSATQTLPKDFLNKVYLPLNEIANKRSSSDEDCRCEGKLTKLTLRYNGDSASEIKVVQKNKKTIFQEIVSPGQDFELIGTLRQGRHTTLGPWINVYIGNSGHLRIHTSCSIEINIGDIIGDFLVVSGESRNNGLICGELPPSNDFDLGDAPVSYGEASHLVMLGGPYLGTTAPDTDESPQFSDDALADDSTADGIDDEGGSVFIQSREFIELCDNEDAFLLKRDSPTFEIVTNGVGFVNAWIDWNIDGIFSDDEQIISQLESLGENVEAIVVVPRTAITGVTFMRLRYGSDPVALPTGESSDGEVEDCTVRIF